MGLPTTVSQSQRIELLKSPGKESSAQEIVSAVSEAFYLRAQVKDFGTAA